MIPQNKIKARIKRNNTVGIVLSYSLIDNTVTLPVSDDIHPYETITIPADEVEFIAEQADNIDWEQRRYEVAKELMAAFIASPHPLSQPRNNPYEPEVYIEEYMAKVTLKYTNALIKALKGGKR